jgi:hypothetical protein
MLMKEAGIRQKNKARSFIPVYNAATLPHREQYAINDIYLNPADSGLI